MGKNNKNSTLAALGLAVSLGINLVACIGVGLFAGKWLDGFFGTAPVLTVAGIVLGVVAGFWSIYKKAMNF